MQFMSRTILKLLGICLLCSTSGALFAQTELVGKVTDNDSAHAPFFQASVVLMQETKVLSTQKTYFDGTFRIRVKPSQTYQIKVSFPGYVDSIVTISTDKKSNLKDGSLVIALQKNGLRLMGYILDRAGEDPIPEAGLILKNVMTRKEDRYITNKDGYYNMRLEYETNYSLKIDKRSPGIMNHFQDTSFYLSTIGFNKPLDFRLDIKLGPAVEKVTPRPEYDPKAVPDNKNLKPIIEVYGIKDSLKKQEQDRALAALNAQLRQKDSMIAGIDKQLESLKANTNTASVEKVEKPSGKHANHKLNEDSLLNAQKAQQRLEADRRFREAIELEKRANVERQKREALEKLKQEEIQRKQIQSDYEAALQALANKRKKLNEEVAASKAQNQQREAAALAEKQRMEKEAADKKAEMIRLQNERAAKEKTKREEDLKAAQLLKAQEKALAAKLAQEQKERKAKEAADKLAREKAEEAANDALFRQIEQERREKAELARINKEKAESEKKIAEQHRNDSLAVAAQLKLQEKQQRNYISKQQKDNEQNEALLASRRQELEQQRNQHLAEKNQIEQQANEVRNTAASSPPPSPEPDRSGAENARQNLIAYYERKLRESSGSPAATEVQQVKMVRISGRIVNHQSGRPIPDVTINVRKLNTIVSQEIVSDENGAYDFQMDSGYYYLATFYKQGFKNGKQLLDLTDFSGNSYQMALQSLEVKEEFSVNDKMPLIFFDKNTVSLPPGTIEETQAIISMMKQVPDLTLKIYGLASCDEESPIILSVGRAKEFAKLFLRAGIEESRIRLMGLGNSQTRSGCKTPGQCTETQLQDDRVLMYKVIKD
ncbi:MAG: hypothetical protein U0T73_13330 [Chitinophagales bacterium]